MARRKGNSGWSGAASSNNGSGGGCNSGTDGGGGSDGGGGGGDGGGGGGGGNFTLLPRPSALLMAASRLVGDGAASRRFALGALRGYQALLSRFTVACPQPVSCSAFAVDAVHRHGGRSGLRLAAARVTACG
ncbi:membrane protein insertion efficiency factor YidD [Allokutzneria sp. A3M-2-11 16]|uniref:membrane protein insertion efficiency factor YidD n=1 Tax=Allokutzneria sp. A3M-2-11 16 TaxID=2962043 RepID=UPI0020B644D7|nr:membrane protein insertion efficiency factor YidD [Allokutzneria sp. A3M-2-11 16]MCP3801830.1 membrane protein insertion efficiency factor YidD [Allokutzneria sp. A3M-2-11 16]